jgi:hypothetical protein
MTLRPRYLAGVLAVGLALTACSSSGSSTPPAVVTSQATTTSPPPTTFSSSPVTVPSTPPVSAPATGTAPSEDALNAVVVQQSDVPAGYTSAAPDASSDDDAANEAKVVQCVGSTDVNPTDRIEEVHSNDFAKDPQTVSSDATSYKSQAAVDALVAVIQNPKAQGCFDAFEREQVASLGGTVNSSNVTINAGSSGGPSNVVALLQGTVNVTIQGQKATVNVVEGFIEGRQLLATVSVVALNTAVDVNLFKQVGAAVANRAAAA